MRVWGVLPYLLVSAACAETHSGNPDHLVDQSGAVFGWECDSERCRVTPIGDDPPLPYCNPETSRAGYSYTWGFMVEITAMCTGDDGGWGALPGWARFVVCEEDSDCPQIPSKGEDSLYVCNAGFCKNVRDHDYFDSLLNRWAMETICIGDAPRFEIDNTPPELRAALETACPGESHNSECLSVPPGCRDPRG